MTDYLSKKIQVLSLLAIIGVLYIHAYNLQDRYLLPWTMVQDRLSAVSFIEYFVSNGLMRFAVPIFFGVSGYLFFLNLTPDPIVFWAKFVKRLRTLAIPWLLWASWGFFVVWYLQRTEWGRPAVDTWDILPPEMGVSVLLYRWLGNPVPFQLWFVRDLLLYVALSPLIYLALRYLRWVPIALVGLLWLIHMNLVILEAEGILFFLFGSYLALNRRIPEWELPGWIVPVTGAVWLVVLAVKTLLAFSPEPSYGIAWTMLLLQKVSVLLGVVTVWCGYDYAGEALNENVALAVAAPFSSFIYFAHEPLLNLLQNYALRQWDSISPLAVYLTYPLLTVCLCLCIGAVLRTYLSPVFSLLTGGRGAS